MTLKTQKSTTTITSTKLKVSLEKDFENDILEEEDCLIKILKHVKFYRFRYWISDINKALRLFEKPLNSPFANVEQPRYVQKPNT